ncbi:hypothetical protein GGR88_002519 [Sphingomonas jejuensis]|uniref:Uncharacterized protein n=1 Tax=Sphingomonas jejuensis TaxID=904715 RepID=A0ABX0XNZ7_9SPHN|nr:hypothetical protein [Sphingomonas jejuensis]NJC35005.1 hypothetical protein [Sphingomonas jejuensis]
MPLAVRDSWGAFIDQQQDRCWAVARPEADGTRRGSAAAYVAMARGTLPRLQITTAGPVATARLLIDGQAIPLAGSDTLWWPAAADARVLRALRGGRTMTVAGRGADGRVIRHRFLLGGAATAIDAAILACAPSRPVANRPQ